MVQAQRVIRLLPRVAAGAAIASPIAWMVGDQKVLCEDHKPPVRQSTLKRLKSLFIKEQGDENDSVSGGDGEAARALQALVESKFNNVGDRLQQEYGEPFVKLLNSSAQEVYSQGEHIFRTHEPCNDASAKLYWILDGAVEVTKESALEGEGAVCDVLKSGACFGDIALVAKEPRRVRNTHASRDSLITAIRKDDFEAAMIDINPMIGTKKGDTVDARVLAFAEMVSPTTQMRLWEGEAVFRQGDTCDDAALYIVKSGSLKMLKSEDGKEAVEVKQVEAGECVGYISLFLKDKSKGKSYTVLCDSPSAELAVIKGDDFHRLIDRSQMVANHMKQLNSEFYQLFIFAKSQEAQVAADF